MENRFGRHFTYVVQGRFTNRKHRRVTVKLRILGEGEFILRGVTGHGPSFLVDINVPIGDLVRKLPSGVISTVAYPVFPEYKAAPDSMFKITAELDPDVDVGRKRPVFTVALIGEQWDAIVKPFGERPIEPDLAAPNRVANT